MTSRNKACAILAATLILTGCAGGAKVLKEPYAQPIETALSTASDEKLAASLDWVIIREGPGAWASRADWDEYLLSVRNPTDTTITVTGITLIDSLGTRIEPGLDRSSLIRGSRQAAKRYKKADLEIHAGMTGAGLFATGTGLFLAGGYIGGHVIVGTLLGTTAGSVLAPAAVGAVLAAPVLIVGSVVRGVNNSKVDSTIKDRKTMLPLELVEGGAQSMHVFFPISPSPRRLDISYTDDQGQHTLLIDTDEALQGLHLESLEGDTEQAR